MNNENYNYTIKKHANYEFNMDIEFVATEIL